MRTGAVAVLDALGYKGIWRRYRDDPMTVIRKMEGLQKKAMDSLPWKNALMPPRTAPIQGAAFLSDTVVIGVQFSEPDPGFELLHATYLVGELLELALEDEPHLAYRGCVAYGSFLIRGTFALGEAIDEAAEHHESAEAALVWLGPSAMAAWQMQGDRFGDVPLVEYDVPLKNGQTYRSYVISPFDETDALPERRALAERMLATFDVGQMAGRLSVQIKRQKTEAFLNQAVVHNIG